MYLQNSLIGIIVEILTTNILLGQVAETTGLLHKRLRSHDRPQFTSDQNYVEPDVEYIEDSTVPDEQRLMSTLLHNYETASRPVYNASHTVTVLFGLTLAQIFDMDEVNQVLTTNVWLEQEWIDERLRWDPANYSDLRVLRMPCQRIWLPDIVLYNSADDFTEGFMQSKAMVSNEGVVFWAPPAKLRSSCKIDITYFPFDDQKCHMKFGSWTYDGFQVDVTNRSHFVDLNNYVYSGEWDLLDVTVKRNEVFYACCIEPYPDVTFIFLIRRRTLYYLFNIIFPCLWLTVLSLLSFWLPPDSGEKITLGITVLLAFSVFMLLIAESMPATSEFVPLIGIYLTVTMAMTSLSIMLTVFVLQLHHAGPNQKPVPDWLRIAVIDHVARILCMRGHLAGYYGPDWTYDEEAHHSRIPGFRKSSTCSNRRTSVAGGVCSVDTLEIGEDSNNKGSPSGKISASSMRFLQAFRSCSVPGRYDGSSKDTGKHRVWDSQSNRKGGTVSSDAHTTGTVSSRDMVGDVSIKGLTEEVSSKDNVTSVHRRGARRCSEVGPRTMKIYINRHESVKEYEDIVNEWRLVAHIMDRLLFWLFLFASVLSTVIILVVMPLTKPSLADTD